MFRSLCPCVAGIFCLALAVLASLPAPTHVPAQVPPAPAGENTCVCEPPIPSRATATGTCTRTQDDGTYCELTFSLSQKARIASQSPAFSKFAAEAKLSKEDVAPLITRLESPATETLKTEDIAASVRAAAAIAAFQRTDDKAQGNFLDIYEMLTLPTADPNNDAVRRSLERFVSKGGGAPEFEKTFLHGRTYRLITTAGCINFNKEDFTFMVRARGTAPPCD
jgi:hypothetical protein